MRGNHSNYFFLSYAHAAPLADADPEPVDFWVRTLFDDLCQAVRATARLGSGIRVGFFDGELEAGADWKARIVEELGTAGVFVPLYSSRYFAMSWQGREWSCFATRLADEPPDEPSAHIVPVLWAPMFGSTAPPLAPDPLMPQIARGIPEYGENGLRALKALNLYGDRYDTVVARLGERIVRVAKDHPLDAVPVPPLDQVPSAFKYKNDEDGFVIVVAAPTRATAPGGRNGAWYGDDSTDWRPFGDRERLRLADYAVAVAERLNLSTSLLGVGAAADVIGETPAVVLIDPWITVESNGAESDALRALRRLFSGERRRWTAPLIVVSPEDDQSAARRGQLVDRVERILGEVGAPSAEPAWRVGGVVTSIDGFARAMPALVAEAERRYLRFSQHFPDDDNGVRPPRFGGGFLAPRSDTRERRDGSGT
jgi:FxsC-like protein